MCIKITRAIPKVRSFGMVKAHSHDDFRKGSQISAVSNHTDYFLIFDLKKIRKDVGESDVYEV